jgi:cytochrome c556
MQTGRFLRLFDFVGRRGTTARSAAYTASVARRAPTMRALPLDNQPTEISMQRFASLLSTAAAGLLAATFALPAAAQFAKPEDAIKYRRAAFTVMGAHFGRVAAMANGKMPFDAKAVAENAEIANMVAKLPYAGFVDGSDKGDTKAEPKIWTEMDKFRAAATKMQEEMAKLNVVAKGGNIDQIKAAVGDTGKSCKACHDSYRKE